MSSQALAHIGEIRDLYYADPNSVKKAAINVEYNTRFTQQFSNLSTGTSVFTIPPQNGLRHVVITLKYDVSKFAGQTGQYVLPRGWGYLALQNVSFRLAASSQYFLSGQQLLQRAMRLCRTTSQRNSLLQLGGNECKVAADFAVDQYAYVVVPIWCPPSDDAIAIPLPTDLLSQQTQITASIAPISAFWAGPYTGLGSALPPTSFADAFFTVEQLVMTDRGQSMANNENMMRDAYGMPLAGGFDQQELVVPLLISANSQPATLTGFRAGSCKSIQMWLTKDSDTANLGRWYAPKSVVVLYAGTIYANYIEGTSQIFNLLDGTAPAAVDYSALSPVGAVGPATSAGVLNTWVSLPFGQPTGDGYSAEVFTEGMNITNGIVNLQIQTPTAEAYTLHCLYNYNCTAVISKGSCELLF